MTPKQAQEALDSIGPMREFTVVFTKKDGTTRTITGFMEIPEGEPRTKEAVPVKVTQGDAAGQWRSFRIDSVVEIESQ